MTLHFISDTHFGHTNIIKFCDRPFQNVHEMDEFIIEMWNKFVQPEDHIYHLGDVTLERGGRVQQEAFIKLIKRLNGHKRLLLGNHDHFPTKTYLEAGFEKIYGTWRGIDNLLLCHIPVHTSSIGTSDAIIHGHIHNNQSGAFPPAIRIDLERKRVRVVPYINLSVEAINYHPVTLETVKKMVDKAKKEFMGKVLEFVKKQPTEDIPLTEEEVQACKVAEVLRKSFTDEQVEAIRKDLENEE